MRPDRKLIRQPKTQQAFTLLELLVVLAIFTLLAITLLPALAATKPGSKITQCLNNKRQLSVAWLMYAHENNDNLVPVSKWINSSVFLDWSSSSANTNAATMFFDPSTSVMASYLKKASVFKCPADNYQSAANPGPRIRSVSLNGALSGGPTVRGTYPGNRAYYGSGGFAGICTKIIQLTKPGPANVFTILDEHPDSINDGVFMFDPGASPGQQYWRDLPASYHNNAGSFAFADGHSEIRKWNANGPVSKTFYPVGLDGTRPWAGLVFVSADYEWMNAGMPYQ